MSTTSPLDLSLDSNHLVAVDCQVRFLMKAKGNSNISKGVKLLSFIQGTNDKAGGPHYVLKWTSMQAIKETFVPLREITYPYMEN